MKRLYFLLLVLIGCSTNKEYDYSRIKLAPENYYEALEPEMFDGNNVENLICKIMFLIE